MSTHELTLAELRHRYVAKAQPLPRAVERALEADPRAGARHVLAAVRRRRAANRAEGQRLRRMLSVERALWAGGVLRIAGVDEAGMSPLAGPVVAAAVVLPPDCPPLRGVDDSKALDPDTRERLADLVRGAALAWGIGAAEPAEIDAINIHHAGLLAMRRAVDALGLEPEMLLVDGKHPIRTLSIEQRPIIGGDGKSLSIAAASILAKTDRDARMVALDRQYPGYGFARHKGYPVDAHRAALARLGVTPVHRRSFGPVKAVLG